MKTLFTKTTSRTNAQVSNYPLKTPPKVNSLRGDQKLPPIDTQSALLGDFPYRRHVPP